MKTIRTVAIVGGGPSGCALATLLKRKGFNVAVFYLEKRPEIIVGESSPCCGSWVWRTR